MEMSFEDIPYCDTFYPTWDQFNDFETYVEGLSKITKGGIAKVTPVII